MNDLHLRPIIKQQRQSLSSHQKQIAARQVFQHIRQLAFFSKSQKIGLYWAVKGELDPIYIEQWCWDQGKECFLPKLDSLRSEHLIFKKYQSRGVLVPNQFNIPEPQIRHPRILSWQLDIIFVPLVAFDEQKNRLGMGAGFYDRTLAFTKKTSHPKPWLVGLAYDWQKVEKLVPQAWDIPLDIIVTDRKIYR